MIKVFQSDYDYNSKSTYLFFDSKKRYVDLELNSLRLLIENMQRYLD